MSEKQEELKKLKTVLKRRDAKIIKLKEDIKYWQTEKERWEEDARTANEEREEFRTCLVKFLNLNLSVNTYGTIE